MDFPPLNQLERSKSQMKELSVQRLQRTVSNNNYIPKVLAPVFYIRNVNLKLVVAADKKHFMAIFLKIKVFVNNIYYIFLFPG